MKQLVLISLLLAAWGGRALGQNPSICRLGFTYDISQSANWGKGKPVVTKVYPYSSAEQVGVKPYDIIESIEGVSVTEMTPAEIAAMLNPAGKNEVTLQVTNLTDLAKLLAVGKECKRTDAIPEDQLAVAFSMYSPENTSERLFTCPFKTTVTPDTVDFRLFKTFGFGKADENNRRIEESINAALEKEFKKKGLSPVTSNPDILIETYYSYQQNPNYRKSSVVRIDKKPIYRYDYSLSRMEKFPFLDVAVPESEAEYLLQLGVRLIDRRIKPGRTLWEVEANELMESPFRLDSYAQSHIPLMCQQYPYTKYIKNVQFLISQKSYNYTGIQFDINHLNQVMEVDLNSPAHAAGIRIRDVIEKIDGQSMNHSAEEFTAAYKQFITNTMPLRDERTAFTDANGFQLCMLWDKMKYSQVVDAVQNPYNMTAFTYLYKFAPYISPSGTNACVFTVRRGKDRREVVIRPAIHAEMTVEIK
jgi:hypothetical protein